MNKSRRTSVDGDYDLLLLSGKKVSRTLMLCIIVSSHTESTELKVAVITCEGKANHRSAHASLVLTIQMGVINAQKPS